jgi:hypothetical protein
MHITESEADYFNRLDFGVDAFDISIRRAIIKEIQDVWAPSLKRPVPLHHDGII